MYSELSLETLAHAYTRDIKEAATHTHKHTHTHTHNNNYNNKTKRRGGGEREEVFEWWFHRAENLVPILRGGGGFSSPAELKHQITEALLSLSKTPGWSQRFERWRLLGYAKVDESFFDREDVVVERVRGLSIAPAYY